MAKLEFAKECKLCDAEVKEEQGPVHGYLHGIFPITFCPECYSALDMFFNPDDDEESENEKKLT